MLFGVRWKGEYSLDVNHPECSWWIFFSTGIHLQEPFNLGHRITFFFFLLLFIFIFCFCLFGCWLLLHHLNTFSFHDSSLSFFSFVDQHHQESVFLSSSLKFPPIFLHPHHLRLHHLLCLHLFLWVDLFFNNRICSWSIHKRLRWHWWSRLCPQDNLLGPTYNDHFSILGSFLFFFPFLLTVPNADNSLPLDHHQQDIPGKERYGKMTRVIYQGSVGAVVVTDFVRFFFFFSFLFSLSVVDQHWRLRICFDWWPDLSWISQISWDVGHWHQK